MKSTQICTIALAAVLMAAPQGPSDGTLNGSWTIEGRVLLGNQPVPEATVLPQWGYAAVRSDQNGHYVLKGATPGNYIIYATKEHAGTSQTRSISVLPGSKTTSIDLTLDNSVAVSGKVLDSDGDALSGIGVVALVRTFRNGGLRFELKGHTATSDSGEFRIEDLAEGRYYLLATWASTARGLEPRPRTNPASVREPLVATVVNAFYPNADSFEGAVPLKLDTGEQRGGVNIVLNKVPTGCVFATVAQPPEVPQGGQRGTVSFQICQAIGDSYPTMAVGRIPVNQPTEVCGLPQASYRVFAVTQNQDPVTDGKKLKVNNFVRADFILGKRDVDLGTLYPEAGLPINGVIAWEGDHDQNALPAGISVALDQQGRPVYPGEVRISHPQADGRFLFESVLVDDYHLLVSGLPEGTYVKQADQRGRDVLRELVHPGNGDVHIAIAPDGAIISGQTVDADQKAVNDVTVILASEDHQPVQARQSDQNGHFRFASGVAPGKYRLAALAGLSEGEAYDPAIITNNLTGAIELELSPGATKNLNLMVRSAQ